MSARRKSKRAARAVTIKPDDIELVESTLVLTEQRGRVLHKVVVHLGHNEHWLALLIARKCRQHVKSVRDIKASSLSLVQKALDDLGGDK